MMGWGNGGRWPANTPFSPLTDEYYRDGYCCRGPGGTRYEAPSSMSLDSMLYPDRPYPTSDAMADQLDLRSRNLSIGIGNLTGRKNGTEY